MSVKLIGLLGQAGSGKDTAGTYLRRKVSGLELIAFADPLKEFCKLVFGFTDEQVYGTQEQKGAPDPRYANAAQWRHARVRMYQHETSFIAKVVVGPLQENARHLLYDWFAQCEAQGRITPRFAMQTLGTEWGRKVDENIWALYACSRAHLMTEPWYRMAYKHPTRATLINIFGLHKLFGYVKYVAITDCRFINEAQQIRAAGGEVWQIVRPNVTVGAVGGVAGHASEAEQTSPRMQLFVTRRIHNDTTLSDFYDTLRMVARDVLCP